MIVEYRGGAGVRFPAPPRLSMYDGITRVAERGKMGLVVRQRSTATDEAIAEEEARLLRRTQSCSAEFAPLYERYFLQIYAYCLRRVGRTEEAEDLTSSIFARALSGAAGYHGGSVAAWLFRIAHNAVIDYLRRNHPSLSLDATLVGVTTHTGGWLDPTLERIVDTEARALIARLIAALPEEQREILALTVAGELSAREIGLVIGKSEGAVWTALHRITRRLRAAYQETTGGVQ